MKIALAQFNPTVGDFAGNSSRILDMAGEARARGAQLAVFSELCLCGYLPQDLLERPAFIERNRRALQTLADKVPLPSLVGYVGKSSDSTGKPLANSAVLIAKGRVIFEQQKILLPTYDVFDESRYFQPGRSQQVLPLCGERLGITICEDIWNDKMFWAKHLYERDPVTELAGQGTTVLINISASPYTIDKRTLRLQMLQSLARTHKCPVVYVSQVGGNDSLVFDGGSVALMPDGRIAAQTYAFREDLVLFDSATGAGEIRPQPASKIALVYEALVCGTRDYVRKCGFREVLVGLSGGIDSAVVAAIAAVAVGAENVLGVAMPGPYSSPASLEDARQLSRNLGVRFLILPIQEIFESYRTTLEQVFKGLPVDTTEENLQARIRGALLMALSNKLGNMVLSTGNKSEMAVGYCTLYGDMAGGLAVISDVPKTMVYGLAEHINQIVAGRELIPGRIITRPPSAELRPDQTDQDTLPPYDVLDRFLRAYVEDMCSPEEIAEQCGMSPDLARELAQKVDRNEYKRKQAPPGLKITSKAFSVGRPFPIAQKFQT